MKRVLEGPEGELLCPRCQGNVYQSSDGVGCMHCGAQHLRLPRKVAWGPAQSQRLKRNHEEGNADYQHRRQMRKGTVNDGDRPMRTDVLMGTIAMRNPALFRVRNNDSQATRGKRPVSNAGFMLRIPAVEL